MCADRLGAVGPTISDCGVWLIGDNYCERLRMLDAYSLGAPSFYYQGGGSWAIYLRAKQYGRPTNSLPIVWVPVVSGSLGVRAQAGLLVWVHTVCVYTI